MTRHLRPTLGVAFQADTAAQAMMAAAKWAVDNLHELEVPTLALSYDEGSFEMIVYYLGDQS